MRRHARCPLPALLVALLLLVLVLVLDGRSKCNSVRASDALLVLVSLLMAMATPASPLSVSLSVCMQLLCERA